MTTPIITPSSAPLEDLVAESQRVLAAAQGSNVVLRLVGGLAIRRLCPSAENPPLSREYADLDLAIVGQSGHPSFTSFMVSLGYAPDEQFNALHGASRLYFNDLSTGRHVDVFVNAVRMCHVIDFRQRLQLLPETLTPTDLLLTKMQIVQLNHKDVQDALALLHDVGFGSGVHDAIDVDYLEEVWGSDWALWRTCQLSLIQLRAHAPSILDERAADRVLKSVDQLDQLLSKGKKKLRWVIRSQIGDRIRWYDEPEEVK